MSIETVQLNETADTQIFEQVQKISEAPVDPSKIAIRCVLEAVKNSSYSAPITEADLEIANIVPTEDGWTGIVLTSVTNDRFYRVEHVYGDKHILVSTFRKTAEDAVAIIKD